MNGKIEFASALFCLALVACESNIAKSDIIGHYTANHGHGIETLELLPNGEYVLLYKGQGTPSLENRNKWQFDYTKGTPQITFSKYVFGYRGDPGAATGPGYWDVSVTRTVFGKIRLEINSDLGYYYYKD